MRRARREHAAAVLLLALGAAAAATATAVVDSRTRKIDFDRCDERRYLVFMRRGTAGGTARLRTSKLDVGVHSERREFHFGVESDGSCARMGYDAGALGDEQLLRLIDDDDVDFIACNARTHRMGKVADAQLLLRDATKTNSSQPETDQCAEQSGDAPWHLERLSDDDPVYRGNFHYLESAANDIDVYILDTGVNIEHPDFHGRAVNGFDATGQGFQDDDGHGSHVAGLAASTTYGAAKKARVYNVKVLKDDGVGDFSGTVKGVEWVVSNAQKTGRRSVMNLSLGGQYSAQLNNMFDDVVRRGICVVVASGNDGGDACQVTPASASLVVAVGATSQRDTLADFSNRGSCVDVLAPGLFLTSLAGHGSGTAVMSGTSMASPVVAGLAALMMSSVASLRGQDMGKVVRSAALTGKISDVPANTANALAHVNCSNFDPSGSGGSFGGGIADGPGGSISSGTIGAIVGAALGGLLLTLAMVGLILWGRRTQRDHRARPGVVGGEESPVAAPPPVATAPNVLRDTAGRPMAAPSAAAAYAPPPFRAPNYAI